MMVIASLFSSNRMILKGGGFVNEGDARNNKAAISTAKLVRFKADRKKRDGEQLPENFRHAKVNETPLPLHSALQIHSINWKKSLIKNLAEYGPCAKYHRVQNF